MSRLRWCCAFLGCVLVVVPTAGAGAPAVGRSSQALEGRVVVPQGEQVQIAVAVDDTGFGASFGPSAREAVQMAIERHPTIRGFAITVNAFNAPCDNGSPASLAVNAASADAVVGNAQNVAVLGHACSPEAGAWLPIYETARLATINGSTSGPSVAPLGPTVFNGTAVPDPDFTPWYAAVKALPSDLRWRSAFHARFGAPPSDYADLYYDAANVLITALEETAAIDTNHDLVIDSAALATTIRHTRGLPGVTCSITLDPATGYRVDDPATLARCASASSEIVFASDRANANPGEIYSLAAGRAPVNVSKSAATDQGAAVSPDGKLVAFWSDRTGTLRLYLSRPDGSRLRVLPQPMPGSAYGAPLVFSPDGSRLLAAANGASCNLYLVDLRSRQSRRIADSCGGASWSPDGSRIVAPIAPGPREVVFDSAGQRRFSVLGVRALWSAQGELAVVNRAGSATVVVDEHGSALARLPAAAADWTTDGSRLVLARPGAILLADSVSPRRTRLLVRGPKNWAPYEVAFTPDGGFVRYPRASGSWVATPVTGGRTRVLPGAGVWARNGRYAFTRALPPTLVGGLPRLEVEIGDRFGRNARSAGQFDTDYRGASSLTWSADGSRLLYESSFSARRDLLAVDPDGSNLHRLTQGGPDASAPAWSADGSRLAYDSASFTGGMCSFCSTSVDIATSDGRLQSTIPGGSAGQASLDGSPSWSPSGTQLVVSSCCSGDLDIVGDDGSGRRLLAHDVPGPGIWSPDGASIAYLAAHGDIDLIAPDGSGQRTLLAAAGTRSVTAMAWSHDGKLLAYSTADGVHILTVDGSAPPRLLVAARMPGGLSFSSDDSQIVYAAQRPGPGHQTQSDLFVISLQGGPSRALAPSPYDDMEPAWRPLPAS